MPPPPLSFGSPPPLLNTVQYNLTVVDQSSEIIPELDVENITFAIAENTGIVNDPDLLPNSPWAEVERGVEKISPHVSRIDSLLTLPCLVRNHWGEKQERTRAISRCVY